MQKIVSLFDSQEELGLAIEELAQANLADLQTEVIDNLEDSTNQFIGAPVTSVNPSVVAPTPIVINTNHKDYLIDKLGVDESEAEFLAHSFHGGASLLMIEVDKKYLDKVLEILEKHGGQIFEE
jgi:hypothetical protein